MEKSYALNIGLSGLRVRDTLQRCHIFKARIKIYRFITATSRRQTPGSVIKLQRLSGEIVGRERHGGLIGGLAWLFADRSNRLDDLGSWMTDMNIEVVVNIILVGGSRQPRHANCLLVGSHGGKHLSRGR